MKSLVSVSLVMVALVGCDPSQLPVLDGAGDGSATDSMAQPQTDGGGASSDGATAPMNADAGGDGQRGDAYEPVLDAGVDALAASPDSALPVLDGALADSVAGDAAPLDSTQTSPDAAAPTPDVAADMMPVLPPDAAVVLPPDGPVVLAPDAAPDVVKPDAEGVPVILFQDDFESGELSKWTSHWAGSTVTAGCALAGGHGAQLAADAHAMLFFDFPSPHAAVRVSARVDVSHFVPAPSSYYRTVRPMLTFSKADDVDTALVGYSFESATVFGLRGNVMRLSGGFRQIASDAVSAGPHVIEMTWRGSSQLGAGDGSLQMLVDGNIHTQAPNFAQYEVTSATQSSRLRVGFYQELGSSGYICVDDIVVTALP